MRQRAFTLAEVLITLGIIGVVAAITLPTLIENYQTKVTVNKLKKVYSTLSQAYEFAVQEYDTPKHWNITKRDNENSKKVRDRLFFQVKKITSCDDTSTRGICNLADTYYIMSGSSKVTINSTSSTSAATMDGVGMMIETNGGGSPINRGNTKMLEHVYALIEVDINGKNAPNTYGKDTFIFYLTEYGIIPAGTKDETFNSFNKCYNPGFGCTAWVLQNENMDYLKCNDLSWDGKHKCN
jgi:prepilin-type N-terminal cleavage/methylation domain-containing protein